MIYIARAIDTNTSTPLRWNIHTYIDCQNYFPTFRFYGSRVKNTLLKAGGTGQHKEPSAPCAIRKTIVFLDCNECSKFKCLLL